MPPRKKLVMVLGLRALHPLPLKINFPPIKIDPLLVPLIETVSIARTPAVFEGQYVKLQYVVYTYINCQYVNGNNEFPIKNGESGEEYLVLSWFLCIWYIESYTSVVLFTVHYCHMYFVTGT